MKLIKGIFILTILLILAAAVNSTNDNECWNYNTSECSNHAPSCFVNQYTHTCMTDCEQGSENESVCNALDSSCSWVEDDQGDYYCELACEDFDESSSGNESSCTSAFGGSVCSWNYDDSESEYLCDPVWYSEENSTCNLLLSLGNSVDVVVDNIPYTLEITGGNTNPDYIILDVDGNTSSVYEDTPIIIDGLSINPVDIFITNTPSLNASAELELGDNSVCSVGNTSSISCSNYNNFTACDLAGCEWEFNSSALEYQCSDTVSLDYCSPYSSHSFPPGNETGCLSEDGITNWKYGCYWINSESDCMPVDGNCSQRTSSEECSNYVGCSWNGSNCLFKNSLSSGVPSGSSGGSSSGGSSSGHPSINSVKIVCDSDEFARLAYVNKTERFKCDILNNGTMGERNYTLSVINNDSIDFLELDYDLLEDLKSNESERFSIEFHNSEEGVYNIGFVVTDVQDPSVFDIVNFTAIIVGPPNVTFDYPGNGFGVNSVNTSLNFTIGNNVSCIAGIDVPSKMNYVEFDSRHDYAEFSFYNSLDDLLEIPYYVDHTNNLLFGRDEDSDDSFIVEEGSCVGDYDLDDCERTEILKVESDGTPNIFEVDDIYENLNTISLDSEFAYFADLTYTPEIFTNLSLGAITIEVNVSELENTVTFRNLNEYSENRFLIKGGIEIGLIGTHGFNISSNNENLTYEWFYDTFEEELLLNKTLIDDQTDIGLLRIYNLENRSNYFGYTEHGSFIEFDGSYDLGITFLSNEMPNKGILTSGLRSINVSNLSEGRHQIDLYCNAYYFNFDFDVDLTVPTIGLIGSNPQYIEVGSPYVELGANASDSRDGNLTSLISINTSSLNLSRVGNYAVFYGVSDQSGNLAIVNRTIIVRDTSSPVISLIGSNPQYIEVGNPYVELGANASDNYEGNLTARIVSNSSEVNTSSIGSYNVSYVVNDSSNNIFYINRTVIVRDTIEPAVFLETSNNYSRTVFPHFSFNISDNYYDSFECSLYVDGVVNVINFTVSNNVTGRVLANNLSQGNHTWSIRCEDGSGNLNSSEVRWVFVDNVKPLTRMFYNNSADTEWVNSPTLINFTVTEGETTGLITKIINLSGDWEVVSNGFILDAPLSGNLLYYRSEDLAGNVEPVRQKNFYLDMVSPTISDVSIGSSLVSSGTSIDVEVRASDSLSGLNNFATYRIIYSNGSDVSSGTLNYSSGKYSDEIATPTSEGTFNISVSVTDKAGNIVTDSTLQFRVNNTLPTISVSAINNSYLRNGTQLRIEVTGNNSWYTYNGGSKNNFSGSAEDITINGNDSSVVNISIFSNNTAGNVSKQYLYIVDEKVDFLNITYPLKNSKLNTTFNISAIATDSSIGIESVLFRVTKISDGSTFAEIVDNVAPYSVNIDSLTAADGNYSITVIAEDYLGNQKTSVINVTIDNSRLNTTLISDDAGEVMFNGTEVEGILETITGLNASTEVYISVNNNLSDLSTSLLSTTIAKLNITTDTPGTSRVYFTLSVESLNNSGIVPPYENGSVYVYADHGSGVEELGEAIYDGQITKNGIEYARWYFETTNYSIFYLGKRAVTTTTSTTTSPAGSGTTPTGPTTSIPAQTSFTLVDGVHKIIYSKEGYTISFGLNGKDQLVSIENIEKEGVTINVSGTQVFISEGGNRSIDVDGDGYYDLLAILYTSDGRIAKMDFATIHEKVASEAKVDVEDYDNVTATVTPSIEKNISVNETMDLKDENTGSKNYKTGIVAVIVIVVLILFLVLFARKRKK